MDSLSMLSKKAGLDAQVLKRLFNRILPEFRDSLWLDHTAGTPYPMRKNGFEIISKQYLN